MAEEIKIHITGMIYNQSIGGTYSLVLSEDKGQKRRFSVLIGEAEAQSIALKLNNAKSPRPLSHDLMNSIIRMLDAQLFKVVIYNMINEIFYAEIHMKQGEKIIVVDARTSDAVALAVRSDAPIYINSDILDIVGAVVDPDTPSEVKIPKSSIISLDNLSDELLERLPEEKLNELLGKALEEEKYEMAAKIRDAMEKRK